MMTLILMAVLLIYSRSLRGEFITDDAAVLDMEELYGKFSKGKYRLWGLYQFRQPRSLTHWGYYWTWRVWGLNPAGWHIVNISIHLINIFLGYRILLYFLSPAMALTAAAVFALHPLQVPAVAWISGRAGIQCAMFAYAAILLLLTGFWPLAVLAQVLAQASKQEGWIYLTVWPICFVF